MSVIATAADGGQGNIEALILGNLDTSGLDDLLHPEASCLFSEVLLWPCVLPEGLCPSEYLPSGLVMLGLPEAVLLLQIDLDDLGRDENVPPHQGSSAPVHMGGLAAGRGSVKGNTATSQSAVTCSVKSCSLQ